MSKKKLTVEGMSCGHCKNAVETALMDLEGVNQAEVDLDAKTVTIKYEGVSEANLTAAIENAGPYEVQ